MAFWRKLFKREKKERVTKEIEKIEKKEKKEVIQPEKERAKKIEKKEEVKVLKVRPGAEFAGKILLRPLITEKSALLGSQEKYSFEVAPQANKVEVARAIYDLYGEKPLSVNIIRVRGKQIRYGRTRGRRKNWKKAIITFKPGVKLEVFEGV